MTFRTDIRARAACLLLAVLAIAACHNKEQPTEWHQETGYRWRHVSVSEGEAGFTRIESGKSGVRFENAVSDTVLLGNRILGQGAGVALGDVDGDGRADIFLARTEGCSALYRNLGAWKFEDITKSAGVGACGRHATASTLADTDGDGDLDLILLSTRGPNSIFVNDGKAHFTERKDLGLSPAGQGGSTLTLADVDGDGTLDMYVANYRAYNLDDSIPPQRRAINQIVRQLGKDKFDIIPEFRNEYRLVNRPDMGGLRMSMRGAPDEFYKNVGGRFTKVDIADRFVGTDGKPVLGDAESFTLDARFADLNGDGAPDLYVTNDFEDTDQLWFNNGQGMFRLADWTSQRQTSNSSMGMDVADINGDGLPDFFVDDMLGGDSKRQKTEIPTHTALPKKFGDMETQLQQQRNVLFLNRGDGTFTEISQLAGVQASGWSWGTMFMDVDLDGYQDILIANGHLWDIMDADTQEGLQNRLGNFPWQRLRWQFPTLPLKNIAYRNRGDLTFEDASAKWKFGTEDDISHTLASADLDGDGDLDVVINRLRSPALLLRNDAVNPRVAVRLIGDAPNTQAVGANIRLLNGALPVQQREVIAGGLYMSHSDYMASFAMGKSDSGTLVINWRDGRQTTINNVRPNRLYEITQKGAVTREAPLPVSVTALFEDATTSLGGHTHVEPPFDDWDRQFLLPDALSPLGPGIAWFDLDRDGAEDLLVGSGKGGQIGVFRNREGKLAPDRATSSPAAAGYTALLGLTENGVSRVFAGVSTWQARTPEEMTAQPAVVGIGVKGGALSAGVDGVVGSHESATGPIALGDVDADGHLDLFVGSRALPMRYPMPTSSGLFHNENGKFVFDAANSAALQNVGMVSAATFADLTGDGYAELILAREWGSIVVLVNDGHGKLQSAPASFGFAKWSSRWNGIAAGDLDGDGRMDLVATSWGRNTAMQADSTHPLSLYHGPFGARGEEEMLLARHDPRINAVAPMGSYARVRVAFPDLVSRVNSFASYADASVEKVLGSAGTTARRLEAVTLDNMAFMNRGDHFDAVPLPLDAQLAPAFYAGIADFNGDGTEDVYLAQNFSATSVGNPRYDGGRGLLLTGDGTGKLTPMVSRESGILIYGDQRGAGYADYDGDGRLDLAVSQNGGPTRLLHNRSAKPGLRVRLAGQPSNPDGVGAQVRLVYGDKMGPVREVTAGSGYWSQNGAVQVMGRSAVPTEVWVRWAGGKITRVPVMAESREIVVKW